MNLEALRIALDINRGIGWTKVAKITVAIGFDRTFGIHGPRRIRVKKMKRLFQRAAWQSIWEVA